MSSSLIPVLIVILLIAGIVAVVRVIQLIGDVQKTLAGVEITRSELSTTLRRIDSLASTTETLMKDEVTPTLQIARQTLANVEETTRAVAESSQAVRDVTASVQNVSKLFTLGGPIAQALMSKISGGAGGFFSGIAKGMSMVLGKGKPETVPARKKASSKSAAKVVKPADANTNAVLAADEEDNGAELPKG